MAMTSSLCPGKQKRIDSCIKCYLTLEDIRITNPPSDQLQYTVLHSSVLEIINNIDELVNSMEKKTKNLPSLTFQYYILKKNVYNHNCFNVIENKLIFCNGVKILYSTLIKPIL